MDVYLVPASSTRHALYCEVAAASAVADDDNSASWLGRIRARFGQAVSEGEAAENGEADDRQHGRFRRFVTRHLAEVVAEQRLLWRLRSETTARLFHPDGIDGRQAEQLARREFESDYGRHRRWMIIDGLITAVTGPLFFAVPGPNLVSWYFTFRAVGHFYSMRGARRALSGVTWTPEPSPALTDVALALTLEPEARASLLAAAAEALGLRRLSAFVERVADRSA